MRKQYIYPQNMRASATLWLWSLKDFAIVVVAALFSAMVLASTKLLFPIAVTAAYAFLTIRADDKTILDYIKYATRFFITSQQYYEWGMKKNNQPITKTPKEVGNDEPIQKEG